MAARKRARKPSAGQKRRARQSLGELEKAQKKLLLQIRKHKKHLKAMTIFTA